MPGCLLSKGPVAVEFWPGSLFQAHQSIFSFGNQPGLWKGCRYMVLAIVDEKYSPGAVHSVAGLFCLKQRKTPPERCCVLLHQPQHQIGHNHGKDDKHDECVHLGLISIGREEDAPRESAAIFLPS